MQKFRHWIVLLSVSLLVAACATAAQQKASAIRTNSQAAAQQFSDCAHAVFDDPQYEVIRQHVPYLPKDVTLEQLTDKSYATDDEIKIILAFHPRFQVCRQTFLDGIGRATPTLVPIIANSYARSEDSLIDLIEKKERWGNHVRRVRDITNEVTAQITTEANRIDSGLAEENQAGLARRQAALNAMAQYIQTQQIINAMNRPVVTNCTDFGYSVNCISH